MKMTGAANQVPRSNDGEARVNRPTAAGPTNGQDGRELDLGFIPYTNDVPAGVLLINTRSSVMCPFWIRFDGGQYVVHGDGMIIQDLDSFDGQQRGVDMTAYWERGEGGSRRAVRDFVHMTRANYNHWFVGCLKITRDSKIGALSWTGVMLPVRSAWPV